MALCRLPLDPNLEQLKNQARDLLADYAAGDAEVVSQFAEYHPRGMTPDRAKLTDAQLVLARTYEFPSWPRLHLAADFDEWDIFEWLLEKGADPNARAEVDDDGFGGHTALFNAVVSQAYVCGRQKDAAMVKTLLEKGADTKIRATIRKNFRYTDDERMHEYREVTALEYGEQCHNQRWVNKAALELLRTNEC